MKDLQKSLLVACFANMGHPEWRVLQTGDLTATLAPTRRPLGNNVWGEATYLNLARCQAFFNGRPFSWLLEEGGNADRLLAAGFRKGDPTPEMGVDLPGAVLPAPGPGIRIREAGADLPVWAALLGESFAMSQADTLEFFRPLVETLHSVPLLGYLDGEPAGTAELHLQGPSAALYAVSTKPAARHRGLGRALVAECLARARAAGAASAVLYASPMGRSLYERAGFRTLQTFQEYLSPGHP